MLTFAKQYAGGKYSQFGEAGIIDEVLRRINRTGGVSVEFGAPTKQYCSNTFHLSERWGKYWFDINPTDPDVVKREITADNINDLPHCHLLSMDTDGPDYELWMAYKGRPDIVVIEINSSLPPKDFYYRSDKGASYITMLSLGIAKGYFLVCHTGNLVFLRNEYRSLFPEIIGDGVKNWKEYFNTSYL